jgi:heme-degrading monooxygenase HmoA
MIRVLLERHVVEGMEESFDQALRDVRQSAVGFPGYVSGESLRNCDNPTHRVVVSTWRSAPDWEAWARSEQRSQAQARLAPLLEEPEKVTMFEIGI